MGKSLYDILELEEDATPNKIKNAYLRLKQQFEQDHPETHEQHISAIQFHAIGEAYAILSDPKRRELYDQKLIHEQQRSYHADVERPGSPLLKAILGVLLVALAWMGYSHYRNAETAKLRELKRMELEFEQAKLRQEELRLEAEKAVTEREVMLAKQQEERLREEHIRQDRKESRQYAADLERAEEKERRRKLEEQRELARLETERRRSERYAPMPGPVYITR